MEYEYRNNKILREEGREQHKSIEKKEKKKKLHYEIKKAHY